MGGDVGFRKNSLVLGNHEFGHLTEKLVRCFSARSNSEKFC